MHPLSRAAARGQKARTKLQPQIAELRKKHGKNPERMQKALMELHTEEKVSPLSGCLPSLLQMPAFFLLYHLFSSQKIGGEPNALLGHQLFAAPLGEPLARRARATAGCSAAQGVVYLGLFAIVAAVATFNYRRTKRQLAAAPADSRHRARRAAGAGHGRDDEAHAADVLLHALHRRVVPLAAALYMVTSTTWTAVERAVLYRDMPAAGAAMATAA